MSKVIRSVKNVTKGYSSVQVKVRNATSNDPWGPTGTEMSEIAQLTFNSSNEFYEIMDMLDKRLNDKGKNWRHVLKALKVLDYCLHEGSELVVTWAYKNVYIIKTLREFQYIDEDGRDVGQNVRVSAKELTSLILDEERLRNERSDRRNWKSRVTGIEEYARHDEPSHRNNNNNNNRRPHRPQRDDEEDAEYRLAIEASKYQEEEDRKKRESRQEPNDDDLAKAIKLSKEEEELRRRELEESNAASLFDDDPIQVAQPTGFNQGYQQQGAVDWSGNPIDPNLQAQPTGYINNAYTGFGAQPTGYQQNGYPNGFNGQPTGYDAFGQQQQAQPSAFDAFGHQQQPQPTGFDAYGQQQQQQGFQPQPTGYNPYLQQSSPFQGQQQQQQQPELLAPPGSNNPWATPNQTAVQASKPLQTGSNNPFATSFSRPSTATPTKPTLATLQEQKTLSDFGNNSFNALQQQKPQSEHHAKLNALLASGEGLDTFGNTGDLRIPAQHTAPGTFVNSAGAGLNRINQQRTGNNPFVPNQFTGIPPTTYGGNPNGFGGSPFGGHQVPAATGPAGFGGGGFGQQTNNPFGGQPQTQQQGQDLIQF
ncbi:hypothetical protein F5884DRAFT_299841 [Xylogone sp. PMI_703]|nr:hypothetical protein F5884DRAFT_299841 [Xylogone sp. PMI_703]